MSLSDQDKQAMIWAYAHHYGVELHEAAATLFYARNPLSQVGKFKELWLTAMRYGMEKAHGICDSYGSSYFASKITAAMPEEQK